MPSRDCDTPVLPRLLCHSERTACPALPCPAGASSWEGAGPTCTGWGVSCGQTGSAVVSSTLGLGVVSRTEQEPLSQSSLPHSERVKFCFCVFNCPVSALRENLDAWIWGGGGIHSFIFLFHNYSWATTLCQACKKIRVSESCLLYAPRWAVQGTDKAW